MGSADTAAVRPRGETETQGQSGAGEGALPRWLKFILACFLLPACAGFGVALYEQSFGLGTRLRVSLWGASTQTHWFVGGAAAFVALAVLLWRPVTVYVFGHELVHALATWLCLGHVSNLRASAAGGQVSTSKSNTFIRLAPYAVPLYTLAVALLYLSLDAWWRPLGNYRGPLAAAIGFTLAFHLGFTLWSLHHSQPDFKTDGWLFSLVAICLANILVLAAALGLVYSGSLRGAWESAREVFIAGCQQSGAFYSGLYAMLLDWLPRR